jgi:hypothetical protein
VGSANFTSSKEFVAFGFLRRLGLEKRQQWDRLDFHMNSAGIAHLCRH